MKSHEPPPVRRRRVRPQAQGKDIAIIGHGAFAVENVPRMPALAMAQPWGYCNVGPPLDRSVGLFVPN